MNWTMTTPPPGTSQLPGDFRLDHNGKAFVAQIFAKAAAPGWPPAGADGLAQLRAVVEGTRARSKHRARVEELRRQQSELQAKVDGIDKRLTELAARRKDPSLLDMADIPAALGRIGAEEAMLKEQRKATTDGAGVFEPHIRREQEALDRELFAAAQRELEKQQRAAQARHKELLVELVNVLGPVLDHLIQAQADLGALAGDGLLGRLDLRPAATGLLLTSAGPL